MRRSFTRLCTAVAQTQNNTTPAVRPPEAEGSNVAVTNDRPYDVMRPAPEGAIDSPAFERVPRYLKQKRVEPDWVTPDQLVPTVQPPPPKPHPWVDGQNIGAHITHGDGELRVVGTGEVGFEDNKPSDVSYEGWRGLQPCIVVDVPLPTVHGDVHPDLLVRRSVELTGRGIFTSTEIAKGTPLMNVRAMTHHIGFDSQFHRIREIVDVLVHRGRRSEEDKDFFHKWVLTGQPAATLEKWSEKDLNSAVDYYGGFDMLRDLEIHKRHIGRLNAIVEMNNFLIESPVKEERGMGYWPEAALLNHSCCPNADYEIVKEGDEYHFKLTANRDIKPGEEVLIAYVPPEWRYNDRQAVLRERYRFWCKCRKCSPDVDWTHQKAPAIMVAIIIFCMVVQSVVYRSRSDPNKQIVIKEGEQLRHDQRHVT
eukprot:PhM_4_TR564/c0_g1_i1/m.97144/K11426/SMYD; SET and MYND domain-containing protein